MFCTISSTDNTEGKWCYLSMYLYLSLSKYNDLPSLSSPKLPQPIFLPTRKLGPTMSTPEEEVTECRDVCIALLPPTPRPPTAPVALHTYKNFSKLQPTNINVEESLSVQLCPLG